MTRQFITRFSHNKSFFLSWTNRILEIKKTSEEPLPFTIFYMLFFSETDCICCCFLIFLCNLYFCMFTIKKILKIMINRFGIQKSMTLFVRQVDRNKNILDFNTFIIFFFIFFLRNVIFIFVCFNYICIFSLNSISVKYFVNN